MAKSEEKEGDIGAPVMPLSLVKGKPEHGGTEISFEVYFLRDLIAKGAITLDLVAEYVKKQGHEVPASTLRKILVDDATSRVTARELSPAVFAALRQAAEAIVADN